MSVSVDSPARKERYSNLELLRIVAMLLILAHHYLVQSHLFHIDSPVYTNPFAWRSLFLLIFGAFGKTCINSYVMITGYFMCKSKITTRKYIILLCEIMFYRLSIYFILLFTGQESFSISDFVFNLLPIYEISNNFPTCFLAFFLFIPFINILLKNLSEKAHIYLLILCFFIYILLGTIHRVTFNYISWFTIIYLLAAYIRIYPRKIFSNIRLWSSIMFMGITLLVCSIIICTWYGAQTGNVKKWSLIFTSDSNSFLPFIIGISSFIVFKNLKIKQNRMINMIASSTFGVLCIHVPLRNLLWNKVFDTSGHYWDTLMPAYAIITIVAIFAVCILLDQIRKHVLEKPFLSFWDKHFDSVKSFYNKTEHKIIEKYNITV